MRLSDGGLDLLIAREGKRYVVYFDSRDTPTVGIGHTGPDVVPGDVWTDEQIRDAFARDIHRFEDAVNEAIEVEIEQYAFDALVSFAFNVGTAAFRLSTLVRRINEGDPDAWKEFNRWHIPPEVTSRRNGERDQFQGINFEARIP